jgi:hypothetical protein
VLPTAHLCTIEDGEPIHWPDMTLQNEMTSFEYVQYKVCVRRPLSLVNFTEQVVIRLSQTSTRVTCALEETA